VIETFGLNEFRSTPAGKLSGGWARLLQLAAALVHAPQVVLLDEPTAGLDIAHRLDVWRHIMAVARAGTTVVISTHDLNEAQRCSQVALLSAGVVRATGTTQQVIDQAIAIALRINGDRVLPLAEMLSQLPAVIAAYPQGRGLHIVLEPSAAIDVRRIAAEHSCRCAQIELSFEDAAHVLSIRAPRVASGVSA
jgi:ABC-2 type transport system ATP-binding protein